MISISVLSIRRHMTHHSAGRCSIAALMATALALPVGAQVPTNGLIGYWTGNNTAADASSLGNNGSFHGSYVPGGPGGGSAFNLATGIVTINNNAAYDNFQFDPGWSVGFWFNTNGIPVNPNNETFLGQDNGSGFQPKWFIDYGYTVFGPVSAFGLHLNDFNQERLFLESASVPIPAGWNQLTVVVDNVDRLLEFYLNGESIGVDGLPNYVLRTNAPLDFGFAEPGLSYGGLMKDVVLYDRALTADDVAHLQAVPEPSPASLLAIGLVMLLGATRVFRRKTGVRS